MCRGANRHTYTVTVHAAASIRTPARRIDYVYKTYMRAVWHTLGLNDKKQPRLSRWYNAGDHAKVIIRRECKNERHRRPPRALSAEGTRARGSKARTSA